MGRIIRLAALLVVVGGLATALVAYATAGRANEAPPNHANRLEATFTETTKVFDNQIAGYGILQAITIGSGTVEGFGVATDVRGGSGDFSVHPCGAGSGSAAGTQRIVTAGDTLALRWSEEVCRTPAGLVGTGTYEVDGLFSTGVFAGATGSGTFTFHLGPPLTVTLSGKLNLANDEG